MKIKDKIGQDLLACLRQINYHYGREILVYNKKQPYNGFVVIYDDNKQFFLTTSFHNKLIKSKRILGFLEKVFYLIRDAKIVVYDPHKLSNNRLVRFDGFVFTIFDVDTQKEIEKVKFSSFPEEYRREYFEKCGTK